MPNPTDQNSEEIHEGTEALQAIAEDVEAEREKGGRKASLPDDDTPEDDAETREDHAENDTVGPLTGADGEVPNGAYGKLGNRDGTLKP
ncbi:hypothetical protein [uncultured Demequina sp.]|uniref:hypothetical protein n=1 Tax=uncultured Demequina sp. TaxID=693499 RepID=UPI0025D719A7|nr:hypothetical protein [uncultured Demequina sp.]